MGYVILAIMSITIAVAIITSISTLAGGLIGSITTIRVQQKQIGNQNSQAEIERIEQRRSQRREIRREAYATILNKYDEIGGLIDSCWRMKPDSKSDGPITKAILDIEANIRSLDTMTNVVNLEGPQHVADAAKKAYDTLRYEMSELLRMTGNHQGDDRPLFMYSDSRYSGSRNTRMDAKKALVIAAREVLDS